MSGLSLPEIEELNKLEEEEFSKNVCYIFEKSQLIPKLFQHKPYESYEQLIETARGWCCSETPSFSQEELIDFINAHPQLGIANCRLSALSQSEQQKIKDEEEIIITRFKELNAAYEEKFGFRFVIFVNGRSGTELIPIFESRLQNGNRFEELNVAVNHVFDIAYARLAKLRAQK